MPRVLVLNGPNLQRLGTGEADVYGAVAPAEVEAALVAAAPAGVEVELRQTDHEAVLIGWLHEAADTGSAVILHPAAFAHYSYALQDAVRIATGAGVPVVEVHLDNPAARDAFRAPSVVSPAATGTITGLGADGYLLALQWIGKRPRPAG